MPTRDVLTLEETAKRLNRSPRTLEKWMRTGKLPWRLEKREGVKPVRVFAAGDVERLAHAVEFAEQNASQLAPERRAEGEMMKALTRREPEAAALLVAKELTGMVPHLADMMTILVDKLLVERKAERETEEQRLKEERAIENARFAEEKRRWELERSIQELRRKDWLTPRECFLGWGMPPKMAIERAERGEIVGVRYGKSWRVQRRSLEAFGGATHTAERVLTAVK